MENLLERKELALGEVEEWFRKNLLKLNTEKTTSMNFGSR